ncbi:MAG: hypothetical protein AAGA37_19955 [Actinomycetota bacterium]
MSLPEFDPLKAARRTDRATSHEAARLVAGNVTESQKRVLAAHAAHPDGLIDHDAAAEIRTMPLGSVQKRRHALEGAGLIEPIDEKRLSPFGTPATVYRITTDGQRLHARLVEAAA